MLRDMIQITNWGTPAEMIKTVNGPIRYDQWCGDWAAHIRKDKTMGVERKTEIRTKFGECAVWASPAPDLKTNEKEM